MKVAILFSGWNLRAIVAFCRFCKMRQIPFIVIARNNNDPILLTHYKENVAFVRKDSILSLDLIRDVLQIVKAKGFGKPVLIPSTEYLNRFFLDNRTTIEGLGCVIPLCDNEMYSLISDKSSFEKLCVQYGIVTPKDHDDISPDNIPCVIKPKTYSFGKGTIVAEKPKIILSREDFAKLGQVNKDIYYSQEFVGGDVYYLLYYFSKDSTFSVYSQKNYVQQHDGLSIVAAESSLFHKDPRVKQYTEMFLDIGFHGLVMVEIRDYEGDLYMIEANPRLWGPSQLVLDSGMDLFDRFAIDNGLLLNPARNAYKQGVKYSWFGGIVETSSLLKSLAYHNQYTAENYLNNINVWLTNDVYKRDDTMQVFEKEFRISETC